MSLKDITITGSIGTYPTLSYGQKEYVSSTDQQSFPIEQITGSNGGSIPDFNGQYSTTNLYVNITQSWSGNNDTPVGLVPYVHNTQDEFINGEYSGSALEVTNQSLIDADCEQYLIVNTTLVNYKPYFYYDNITTSEKFLDSNTSPNQGEIYLLRKAARFVPAGIQNIKINRIDEQGNDNTLSLQELTNLRFAFSDVSGIVDYEVITISEYPSYYLYTIISLDVTSSIDNNVLDYSIDVYKTGSFTVPSLSTYGVVNYNNIISNPLGYFDSTYGALLWGSTSNVKLQVTASVYSTASIPPQLSSIILYQYPGIVIASASEYSGTITLSSSIVPLENTTYYLGIENTSLLYNQSYNNVHLVVTQSTSPHSSSNLTVLEPYLTSNFFYNDCNVLYGNADGLEYDINFMSVNYDGNGGSVIPSNQQEILSNTAERAPVKPYNYRLLSQIRPRYLGTKNSTDNFNLRTTTQVAYEENSTNENLGATTLKQPSVSSLGTYFAYFDWIGGTSYELINKKGAHILYLIDKDGNTLTPSLTDPYYSNLIQTFPSNQKINITFSTSTGNVINTQGLRPIIKTGATAKPVIWSQSGSTANSSSTIKFGNDATLPDFTTIISLGTGSITSNYLNMMNTSGSYEITNATNTSSSFNSGSGLTNNNSFISSSADSNRVIIKPRVEVTLQGSGLMSLLFRISSNNGSTIIQDIRTSFTTPTTPTLITWNVNVPPEYANPLSSYRYEFYIEAFSGASVNLKPGGVISLLQDPSITIIGSPYWTTGSSSNILVATSSMFSAFNQTQIFPTSSGYYSNLPFTIQKLDEIRFEGDENQTYVILDPNYSTGGMAARSNNILLLDRDITPGTDLNSFFLRRYIPDPNLIIIDIPGSEASGNGFLFPEYTSLDIQNNFDSIIQNLKAKGVIPST